jgi:hypothetical protein
MVRKLLSVDVKRVNWYDSQQVDKEDFDDEQNRNIGIDAALENNFFGSGVLPEFKTRQVIFDSNDLNSSQQTLFDGYQFDGQNIYVGTPLVDVSDQTQGVQLAVTLTGVNLAGAATTRIAIIGDTFGGDLVHDELTFNENGTQITRGRHKDIRGIIFSDFAGNLNGSVGYALDGYELSGRCVIREAYPMEVSPDSVVESQVGQPSMFFNSFVPASTLSISQMLEDAVGADKSVADLNIALSSAAQRELAANDVTTRIGQKFEASGTNIQKISILLSVEYDAASAAIPGNDGYEWSGSIVMTLHALQTEVDCPVAPTPDDAIDFDPDPSIIAQLTLDADDLEKQGIDLNGTPQIVDFVFVGSEIADPTRTPITSGNYYVFTVGRSGDTSIGDMLLEEATDRTDNSYMTIYDGSQWINVSTSDMWFSVEGSYVKVTDGIAYEDGLGLEVPRIAPDETNTEVPYVEGPISYYTVTRDAYNFVLLEATNEFSGAEQDQRTGNSVYSRVKTAPSISLINQSSLTTLLISEPDPVLLARARDQNPRGNTDEITGTTAYPGLAIGDVFNILAPDADLTQNNWVGSMLRPDEPSCSAQYRIIQQTLVTDAYGDVNGDGEIDLSDVNAVNQFISEYNSIYGSSDIDISTNNGQQFIVDGYMTAAEFFRADVNGDGIVNATDSALILNFVNGVISTFPAGATFERMELQVESMLNPLITSVNIPATCSRFTTVPFSSIGWEIEYCSTWIPDNLIIYDLRRLLPTTFTDDISDALPGGQNDWFVPGDLIIDSGYILNPDGTFYSVDFEVNHLSLDIPITDSYGNPTFLDGNTNVLLFDNFVAESSNGLTSGGFDAMKYADGSYVQVSDFTDGKVKISVALQSVANEYNVTFGSTIKDLIGMYYDPDTSLLNIYVDDLYNDGYGNLMPALSMKILVVVYLKRAGFANATREISKSQMRTLLGI